MQIKNIFLLFTLLLTSQTLTGCPNQKIKDCQTIIATATEIQTQTQNNLNNRNLKDVIKVAQSFQQAGETIEKEEIKDEELAQYSQNLSTIYQKYGQLTLDFISAFETKDQEKAIFYKNELQQLFQQQNELVQKINAYCIIR